MASELDDLEHALDVALKVPWGDEPGAAKAAALSALTRVRAKLDALDAAVLNAFEATQEHKVQGHASAIGWLTHNTRSHLDDAASRRRLAKRLRHQPLAEEALAAGEITARHVDVLERARRQVGEENYRIGEQVLVDLARSKRFEDFARSVDYFILRARPHDAAEREEQQIRDRWCASSRTMEGCGKVDAWLPPHSFTVFDAELSRLAEHLYRQDVAEARQRLGRDPLPAELARTPAQRRADALELMARRSAAHGDGDVPASSFTVNIHAGVSIVEKLLARIIDTLRSTGELDDDDDEIDIDDLTLSADDLCEDGDGNTVTVPTLLLALLTGRVRGFLHDPQGVPLRYGHARRLFSKPQGDSVKCRFRRCNHPYGCSRTGAALQINHVTEHRRGGRTDVDDADTRCGSHNRWYSNTYGQPPPPGHTDSDQRRAPPDLGPLPFDEP